MFLYFSNIYIYIYIYLYICFETHSYERSKRQKPEITQADPQNHAVARERLNKNKIHSCELSSRPLGLEKGSFGLENIILDAENLNVGPII